MGLPIACAAPPAAGGFSVPREPLDPVFLPAFEALEAAVWSGDDAVARQILRGIRARAPGPAEERLAAAFERILEGRRLLAGVHLRLTVHPSPEREGDYVLSLAASHDHPHALVLNLPPATLVRKTTAVALVPAEPAIEERGASGRRRDGSGADDPPSGAVRLRVSDTQALDSEHLDGLRGLELAPGEELVMELLAFPLEVGGSFAVRERWNLAVRSGEIVVGEEAYPAQDPRVEPAEVAATAPWLPQAPVDPAELARYAQEIEISTPALLERAVRIETARRNEGLDRLAALVPELDDQRVAEIVPALRWLSGSVEPGNDPAAWRRWLRYRDGQPPELARRPGGDGGALDLPAATDRRR